MSEHFNEKISEFIDDEMSVEEGEFFVRRLQSDVSARRLFLRYQLIGAAVRGEYRYPDASELQPRLEQALDADEPLAQRSGLSQLATGIGIAASLVLVIVFGLSLIDGSAEVGLTGQDSVASVETRSFVGISTQVTGIQYLMHHANYTSGLNRTIMRSSVISGQESDPALQNDVQAPD